MKKMLAGLICAACAVAVLPLQVAVQAQQEVAATIRSGPPPFPTAEQYASSAQAQEHIAEAMRMAGTDLVAEATAFCTPTGPQRPALAAQQAGLEPEPERQFEPIRVFENLYYLGFSDVGAWAIATSDGIILFDALNSADEARDVIVPGLQKVGLDPAQIKYLIIGHGHNDHTGGGKYIQDTYGPTVIMGGPDWDTHLASTRADRPPMKRGLDASDGQTITVGDTTVTLMLTPGHTPGTIAMLLPIKHNGETHTALIMSGSQMRDRPSLVAFEHVFNDFAKAQNAGTMLGGHADILMNKLPQMEAIGAQYPTGDHPILFAPEKFSRYMDIMAECGRSRLAALEDAGII